MFCPQRCSSHPKTSSQVLRSGLHPPRLDAFPNTPSNDPEQEILTTTSFFSPLPKLSERFKAKQASLCPCCKRGKHTAEGKDWWKTTGLGQVGGQPDLSASSNRWFFDLNAHPRKVFFFPSTCVSAYRSIKPSSDTEKTQHAQSTGSYGTKQPTFLYIYFIVLKPVYTGLT